MDLTKVEIITERLKLIPQSLDWTEEIFKEFTPEITTYMMPAAPERIEDTKAYLSHVEEKLRDAVDLPVVILDKHTNEFLGCAGIHRIKTPIPELGIWLKKSAHGHKYGLEALQAIKQWADENCKYDYIKYPVDKRNIPSRKIAESLGGVISDEYQKENKSGNTLDEVEYRIYSKNASVADTTSLSEKSLSVDWEKEEEDKAWKTIDSEQHH